MESHLVAYGCHCQPLSTTSHSQKVTTIHRTAFQGFKRGSFLQFRWAVTSLFYSTFSLASKRENTLHQKSFERNLQHHGIGENATGKAPCHLLRSLKGNKQLKACNPDIHNNFVLKKQLFLKVYLQTRWNSLLISHRLASTANARKDCVICRQ